jgi:hypothetical protein
MPPIGRTPQQRDHRFARVRRLTQAIFLGAGVVSAALVGYAASVAKPTSTTPTTVATVPSTTTSPPTTTTRSPTTTPVRAGGPATTTPRLAPTTTVPYTPPTTVPVTRTTVCTTTPSGTRTCH